MQLGDFFAGYVICGLIRETVFGFDPEVYASGRRQIDLQISVHALPTKA